MKANNDLTFTFYVKLPQDDNKLNKRISIKNIRIIDKNCYVK